jgi:hypothetical protein
VIVKPRRAEGLDPLKAFLPLKKKKMLAVWMKVVLDICLAGQVACF